MLIWVRDSGFLFRVLGLVFSALGDCNLRTEQGAIIACTDLKGPGDSVGNRQMGTTRSFRV